MAAFHGELWVISTLVPQYVAANRPKFSAIDGTDGYISFQYVGDGCIAQLWAGRRPWQTPALRGQALTAFIGVNAVNFTKNAIDGAAGKDSRCWASKFVRNLVGFRLRPWKFSAIDNF